MENLPELAQQTTALLTPALPFLLDAGKEAATEALKHLGAEAWDRAKTLWHHLWPKVQSQPAALEAAKDAAQSPQDPDTVAALRVQIRQLREQDPALAQQLAPLVQNISNSGRQTIASGNRAVAIGRDASGATFITGDNNQTSRPKE